MTDIDIFPTRYQVTGLDPNDEDAHVWSINIEWRGPGDLWAVCRIERCLSTTGTWDYEPSPSNRTDEYRATHRFPLKEAKRLATEAYPKLIINGLWVRNGILEPADTVRSEMP